MKIVVVDDEPAARYELAKTLRASDRMIFEAEDGEAAQAMLIEHAPDLVFLDLNMPTKDGLNVLLDLAQQQLAVTPVIIIEHLLRAENGNISGAARHLGIHRQSLQQKIAKLGICL